MKNLIKFFLFFYLFVVFFLPTAVLAESYICKGNCADTNCKTFTSLPEANNKCIAPDGAPADACVATPGVCPGDEKPAPPPSSKPPSKNKFTTKLDNPLVGVYGVTDILGNVIKIAMGVMGGAVLVMVVKGATTWISANGNPENIQAGTKTIIWAIIGAVLTVASYVILHAIIGAFFSPLTQ